MSCSGLSSVDRTHANLHDSVFSHFYRSCDAKPYVFKALRDYYQGLLSVVMGTCHIYE